MRVTTPWNLQAGVHRFTRTVTDDESVLCRAKFVAREDAAGVLVTAATIQTAVNQLTFLVNAAAETVIGTYTGATGAANQIVLADANIATIEMLVRTINGLGVGHPVGANLFRRWRAAVADFRPAFAIGATSGLAVGPANALLGVNGDGLEIFADSSGLAVANTMSVGIGVPTARRGSGPVLADHFESDYIVTTAGVLTPQREAAIQQERFDARRFQVHIDSIHGGAAFANNDKILRVYDTSQAAPIWQYQLNAALDVPGNVLDESQPIVGRMGSPVWVELAGTGAFTDGPLTVSGWIKVS